MMAAVDRLARRRAAAERQRRKRERERAGLACYRIEAVEDRLAKALIASTRLTHEETLRRQLVERELTSLVEDFIERWVP